MRKIIGIFLCLLVNYSCSSIDSGTIVWTQTSNYRNGYANAIAIDESSVYIVASDRSKNQRYGQWHIEKRSLLDGSLVSMFANQGVITSEMEDLGRSIGIAADSQYIYVIGDDNSPGGFRNADSQWRIEKRLSSDGSLVNGFGDGGVVTNNPTPYIDSPEAVVIDANYMYIVGFQEVLPGYLNIPHYRSDNYWRIEKRKLSDGSLVSDFGTGGVITSNPNTMEGDAGLEDAHAIAIDADYMYVTGTAYNAAPYDLIWRIDKRRLTDGSLCTEFGDNGVVTNNPSPGNDEANSIAIDAKYMYVVGSDIRPDSTFDQNDYQWHIEKRNLSDGALVEEFGNNGIVINNPSNRIDWAQTIVGDQKYIYVAGRDGNPGPKDQQWHIEKRKTSDGSLVPEFKDSGILTINPSANLDNARAIAAGEGYLYIIGVDYSNGLSSPLWQIVKIKK
jgi:hypothetical protein